MPRASDEGLRVALRDASNELWAAGRALAAVGSHQNAHIAEAASKKAATLATPDPPSLPAEGREWTLEVRPDGSVRQQWPNESRITGCEYVTVVPVAAVADTAQDDERLSDAEWELLALIGARPDGCVIREPRPSTNKLVDFGLLRADRAEPGRIRLTDAGYMALKEKPSFRPTQSEGKR